MLQWRDVVHVEVGVTGMRKGRWRDDTLYGKTLE